MQRILTCCCLLILSTFVQAQDGTLDTSFGTGGKAYITPQSLNQALTKTVVQSDGKVVTAGRTADGFGYTFSVVRFKADGTPDETFDGDGLVVTQVEAGSRNDNVAAVAVQPDGKIIAGGRSNSDFVLIRYNVDGSLDNTFNGTGISRTNLPGASEINSIVVLNDGKILAGGYCTPVSSQSDFTIARYNQNGTLDLTFDGDGYVTTATSPLSEAVYSLAVQADGKIVAAGSSFDGSSENFMIVRYNANGSPDNSFNGNGRLAIDFGLNDVAYSVAVQPDNRIVVAGKRTSATVFNTAIARILPGGQLDNSFDLDGKASTANGDYDEFYSTIVQQDGKILASGTTYLNGTSDFLIVRYNADGSLDNSFDGDGKLSIDMGSAEANATIAGFGTKLIIGGSSGDRLAVARLNNSSATIILPVKLISFTALSVGPAVTLNWKMAAEDDLLRFEVEHSTDGIHFITTATLPPANRNGHAYTFQHTQSSSIRYYRLKMVSRNGTFAYSDIVAVKTNGRIEALLILQNPVRHALRLQIDADEKTVLSIFNAKGALIKQQQGFARGYTSVTIDASDMPAGVYNIHLANRLGRQVKSFVKE